MVAPKKVCFKDEDKSPSPQPFEEPEGMVTIDLNSDGSCKQEGDVIYTEKSEKGKAKGNKSNTCQTFVYLLMFVTVIFALIIILDDYTDLLKRKQQSSKYDWTNKYEGFPHHIQHNILHERKSKLLKCSSSKSLTDCCKWFTHGEFPELVEACILNNLLLSILGNQKSVNEVLRQKRAVSSDGIHENHIPFGDYINEIGQIIADNVPEVLDGLARRADIYDDYDMDRNSYMPKPDNEYFYDYPAYNDLEHQDLNFKEPVRNIDGYNFPEQVDPFQQTDIKYDNPEKAAAYIDQIFPLQEKTIKTINSKEVTPEIMEFHGKPEEYNQTYPAGDYSTSRKEENFKPIITEEFAPKPLEDFQEPNEYLNVNSVDEYTSPVTFTTRHPVDFGKPPVREKTSQLMTTVLTPQQPIEIINFHPDQMPDSGRPVDYIKIHPNTEGISSRNKEPISLLNVTDPASKQHNVYGQPEEIIRYSSSVEGETSRPLQEQEIGSQTPNSNQHNFPIQEEIFQPPTTTQKTSIETKKLNESIHEIDTLYNDDQNYLKTTSSQGISSHSGYTNLTNGSIFQVRELEKNKKEIKNEGAIPEQRQSILKSDAELSAPNLDRNGGHSETQTPKQFRELKINMTIGNNDIEPDLLGIIKQPSISKDTQYSQPEPPPENRITIPCTGTMNGSQSSCDIAKNMTNEESDIHIPNLKETASLGQKLEKNSEEATMKTSKSGFPTGTFELQTSSQTMFTPPCTYPYNYQPYGYNGPYRIAGENGQVYKIVPDTSVPKTGQLILNPPMLSYMPISPMTAPYFPNYVQQTNVPGKTIQVTGPGGQFYVCNPISAPANTVMAMPGVEVRRQTGKLQDIIQEIPFVRERSTNRSSPITCPNNQFGCEDGSRCLPKHFVCDNEIHCDDGSDEMFCSCRDRVGKLRLCDGYPDCVNNEDEEGCFGCAPNEFSCDDWSRFRRSTCIPIEQRCDNIRHCEMTGKDEEDCSVLTDNVGNQPQYRVSNAAGYLHRNYKGHWYPSCFGSEHWGAEVCKTEAGPSNIIPKLHMMLSVNDYPDKFINILPNDDISLVNTCVKDRAAFVECPPLYCGMRMSIRNPYRAQEVETSAEDEENDFERVALSQNSSSFDDESDPLLQNSRVVGGKPSQPAAWPWLVSIYKNGIFHCGGVIINELWIATAAHCVDKYWLYYYEIQAGMLRRFSYSPMEQQRWADFIVFHENYDKKKLKNDIGLIKLSSPLRFNRYVRPICLPTESTAGKEFLSGPSEGTICTTVGWGATIEHGTDPDHVREVEVPVQKHCKHQDDQDGDEICAGLSEGGKDACQGDSGGPFMCRNPNNPSQWYLAGIVSHGEGCARPNEPGVYTRVSRYVEWIAENMRITKFTNRFPLLKCPGYVCKTTGKCLPKKHHCDRIIDCLFGDDEMNCKYGINDIFNHARRFHSIARFLKDSNGESEARIEPRMGMDEEQRSQHSRNSENQEGLQTHDSGGVLRKSKGNGHDQYFRCTELLQLISHQKRCNKVKDCEDGTDEVHCSCGDYLKIFHPAAVCDGVTDCLDLSDETACLKCDMSHEYPCRKSQMCVETSKRCDGKVDCSKGEDELDCAALTNGTTLTLDSDLRPESAMSGIITINRFGVWRPFCANMSDDDPSSIATNVCNLLGSEEYVGYHKYRVEDNPLNVTMIAFPGSHYRTKPSRSGNNTCDGLFVTCSNVSLDYSVHNVYLDEVGRNVELYTTPWNAVIYSAGIFRCMGTILNSNWIVTSVNCFKGTTMLNDNFIVAVVGKGKSQLRMQGPHEQILTIIEMQNVTNSDIVLLRTNKYIKFNRYVNYLPLLNRKNTQRKERCYAVGIHKNETRFVLLKPIERCYVGYRCFESKINECQDFDKEWSGTVVCDSGSGWYPAAVYSEKNGLCGLFSIKKYTNILYHRREINEIMKRNPSKVDAPHCDGFRCKLGECINNSETCDGIPNCSDGEDEDSQLCFEKESRCHLTGKCVCPSTHLTCKNNRCVHKSLFCDRKDDCDDKSDEPDVCSCRNFLQLSNSSKICDGVINCSDGTDEDPEYCKCKEGSFRCGSSGLCVSNDTVCDGANDCPNGEDEKRCLSLVSADNVWLNAGEVLTRTAGIWHNGCFKQNYTSTELDKMCEDLGFSGTNANQLTPSKSQDTLKATRPVITPFEVVWIRNKSRNKLNFGLRTGNDPFVTFVSDEKCLRLFLACI